MNAPDAQLLIVTTLELLKGSVLNCRSCYLDYINLLWSGALHRLKVVQHFFVTDWEMWGVSMIFLGTISARTCNSICVKSMLAWSEFI